MTARLLDDAPHEARATRRGVRSVLDLVAERVPRALAGDGCARVAHQIEIFGLHAARLDIREDSGRLAAALGEHAARARPRGELRGSATTPAAPRVLLRLLRSSRPRPARPGRCRARPAERRDLARSSACSPARAAVYGRESLGPFIISMTRGAGRRADRARCSARWAGGAAGADDRAALRDARRSRRRAARDPGRAVRARRLPRAPAPPAAASRW